MRIVDIRERTAPIASPIANAYIDFSKMTCSVVAVVTDVVRDGKPVVGYGFNSNGRYGRDARLSGAWLYGRQNEDRRRPARRRHRADRSGAVDPETRPAPGRRREWPLRSRGRDRLRQGARPL